MALIIPVWVSVASLKYRKGADSRIGARPLCRSLHELCSPHMARQKTTLALRVPAIFGVETPDTL
jgi:hypothetical protein